MRLRILLRYGSQPLAMVNLVLRLLQLGFAIAVLVDWTLIVVTTGWLNPTNPQRRLLGDLTILYFKILLVSRSPNVLIHMETDTTAL